MEGDPGDLVKVGDLAGHLVCTGPSIALAVIEMVGFERGGAHGQQLLDISIDELEKPGADTHITSQILGIAKQDSMSPDTAGDWFWTGSYLSFGESQSGHLAQKILVLKVPSFLVHLLSLKLGPPPIQELYPANIMPEVSKPVFGLVL